MRIVYKDELKDIMKGYPYGGVVFAEYSPSVLTSELMVTDGDFGATCVIPTDGDIFDFDWNVEDYKNTQMFAVFDHNDVLAMIQTLTKGLRFQLCCEW